MKLLVSRAGMVEYRNIQIIHIIAVTGPVEAVEFCGDIQNAVDPLVAEFFNVATDQSCTQIQLLFDFLNIGYLIGFAFIIVIEKTLVK